MINTMRIKLVRKHSLFTYTMALACLSQVLFSAYVWASDNDTAKVKSVSPSFAADSLLRVTNVAAVIEDQFVSNTIQNTFYYSGKHIGQQDSIELLTPDVNSLDFLSAVPMPMPIWTQPNNKTGDPRRIVAYNILTEDEQVLPFEFPIDSTIKRSTNGYEGDFLDHSHFKIDPSVDLLNFSELSRVTNPDVYPWRVNVKLIVTFPSGTYVCSGVLIDPLHVLTAGHCVYRHEDNAWASSIIVVPGYEYGSGPFGNASATNLYSWSGWTTNQDYDWDMAYMKLDRHVGGLTGYHAYGYDNDDNVFSSSTFYNPGYPAESPYNGQEMWTWSGNFDEVNTHLLYFFQEPSGGQSGSGAYQILSGSRIVYANLSHKRFDFSDLAWKTGDCRITQTKFNSIFSRISSNTPSTFDLVALNVNAEPTSAKAGEELTTFNYYVHNYSSASFGGTVNVKVYLSTNDFITTSDRLINNRSFSYSFGPKSSVRFNAASNLPVMPCDLRGNYYIGIILDISDYNTGNNSSSYQDATQLFIGDPNPPIAEFVASNTVGCDPFSVNFTDISTGCLDSWSWNFGDDGSSSSRNPTHVYNTPGTYSVSLTVTNVTGSDTETKVSFITVNAGPVAEFEGSPRSGCPPLTVCFTDQTSGSPNGWDWDFGDDGTSTQRNPCYTYNTPGSYLVTLAATNQCGVDQEMKAGYIVVHEPVNADFIGNPTTGCAPLTVSFSDQSSGGPTSWQWNFGDNETSNQKNPIHTYTTPGTYNVSLTSDDPECSADTETKANFITVYPTLSANFDADIQNGCLPLAVTFTDLSTGNPTSWSWDFGDGQTSTSRNPTHTYNPAGTYTVSLTVDNSECDSDTEIKSNLITVQDCSFNAEFQATPTVGCDSLQVCFTDQSVGSITSWLWDFGDGNTSTALNPCNMYQKPGMYTVTLIITDGTASDTATKINYINVNESPLAEFSVSPQTGCPPFDVQFTDLSSGDLTGWSWDFGDGNVSVEQDPLHAYANEGVYTVSLIASGPCGVDTITKIDFIRGNCNDLAIGGRVLYFNMSYVIPDVEIMISGDTLNYDSTDIGGDYLFDFIPSGSYTVLPSKSQDEPCVSVADIIKLRRHLAGLETFTSGYQYVAADVNLPPSLNVGDIIIIRRYLVGLEELPVGNWLFLDSSILCTPSNYWLVSDFIDVTLVGTSVYDKNFIGIHAGDVNGSWPSPFAAGFRQQNHQISSSHSNIKIPNVIALPNSVVTLPVTVYGVDEIGGFELHILYESEAIKLINIESAANLSNFTLRNERGELHIVWENIFEPLSARDSLQLIVLNFAVEADSFEIAEVKFQKVVFANVLGDETQVDINNGSVINLVSNLGSEDLEGLLPEQVELSQNFPNPFNPTTTIEFTLISTSQVQLTIYNVLGQRIRTLVNETLGAGQHQVTWDGSDVRRIPVASGIYFYSLKTDEIVISKGMLLLR